MMVRKTNPTDYYAGELSYPVTVMPGEGLADLIFRAAAENGYFSSSAVLGLTGLGPEKRLTHLALAGMKIDPERIAFVLGLPGARDVERLAYPETRNTGTHFDFFGREVRGRSFFQYYRKVSPLSLKWKCYQKAIWSVRGITFDPATREQLLFQCPVCSTTLTSFKSYGVEYCAACYERGIKVDMRDFTQPIIEVDDEEALDLPIALIDPEVDVRNVDMSSVPEALREFGPGAIFELISNIARVWNLYRIDGKASRDALLRHQTPYPDDMAKAARAVMSWPEGFNRLYDKMLYEQRMKYLRDGSIEHVSQRVASPPISQIVSLLDDNLKKTILSKFKEEERRLAFASLGSAAVGDDALEPKLNLSHSPSFRAARGTGGLRRAFAVTHLSRKDDARLKLSDARFLMLCCSGPTRTLARRIGIGLPFLLDLFTENILEALDDALDPHLGRSGLPPKVPLEERLLASSSHREPPSFTLPLIPAVSSLSARRINPFFVAFDAILKGSLEVWLTPGEGNLVSRLRVADFDTLRKLINLSSVADGIFGLPVDNRTSCVVLGLSQDVIIRMHRTHLLQSDLRMKDLWVFHEKYISTAEVIRRARIAGEGMNPRSVAAELAFDSNNRNRGGVNLRERRMVEEHFGSRLAWRA